MIAVGTLVARLGTECNAALRNVFRNAGWLVAAKALGALLSIAYLAIVARSLGPEPFGKFTLILSVAQALAGLVSFQMWRLVLRFGSRLLIEGELTSLRKLVWRCARLDLAAAIVGCILAVPLTAWLGARFHWSTHVQHEALLFAAVMLLTARSTAVGVLRLQNRFRASAIASTSTPIVRFVGAVLVLLTKPGIDTFLLAWAVAEIATWLAYWLLALNSAVIRGLPSEVASSRSAGEETAGFWRFALFTNVNSTLASVGQQVVLFTVGLTSGSAAAGYFRLGYQLAQALLLIAEMVSRSLYAEVESLVARRERNALDLLFGRTTAIAVLAGLLVLVLVIVLGRPALQLIGGAAYLPAYKQLVLLGSAAGVQLVAISCEPALLALNRSGTVLAIRSVSTLFLFLLLASLLPRHGALAGGLALLGESLVLVALLWIAAARAQRQASARSTLAGAG